MLTKDIALYFDGLGYGNFYDGGFNASNNIFLNILPQNPTDVICIYDTGGSGNDIGFPDLRRSVQVYVRNESMEVGNALIWAIYGAMVNYGDNGFTFINGRKMLVRSTNSPISLGKDVNGHFEFSVNFTIITQSDI